MLGGELPVEPEDKEGLVLSWKRSPRLWLRLAKKALRKGVLQETTAADARVWHRRVLQILKDNGATTTGFDDPAVLVQQYSCDCGRTFTTPQGLAAHRRFAHDYVAPETILVKGLTQCPACLRHLWTPARLRQHLSYIPRKGGPNKCYQALLQGGFRAEQVDAEDTKAHIFASTTGIKRRDALRASGPLPDLRRGRIAEYEAAQQRLAEATESFNQRFNFEEVGREQCREQWKRLDEATLHWFSTWSYDEDEDAARGRLQDEWILTMAGDERVFTATILPWGRTALPDLTAEWWTGVAEKTAEEAFTELIQQEETALGKKAQEVRYLYNGLRTSEEAHPHRPVRRGPTIRRGGDTHVSALHGSRSLA